MLNIVYGVLIFVNNVCEYDKSYPLFFNLTAEQQSEFINFNVWLLLQIDLIYALIRLSKYL